MNFFNDDEKKGGAPVIPGAASPFRKTSAFGRAPIFSRAAGSIMDRFKNLSRKDMAFVGIGLSVLVMAPVAEYMMSKPSESTLLTGGFGDRGRGSSSLYEPGFGALSAGSADGSGEVITPLSARDPASLILGSQTAQPVMPPAAAAPPSTSWRDSVKDAGREAFSAASKSAGTPTVIPKLQSTFRSLFGGGGASGTTGSRSGANSAIIADAKSASSKAAKRSMVGPVAMAGYKGVASNTPNSASKGAFEKLRAQADKSAGNFSGGSAMNSLDKAAADAVQLGAGSGGAGGLGEEKAGKGTGTSQIKGYDRNVSPKESLAEMAAKQRMQEALKWEFFKKYEIPKQIINAVVGEVSKWLAGEVGKALKGPSPAGGPAQYCWKVGTGGACYPAFPQSMCKDDKGSSNSICNACVWFGPEKGTPPAGAGCSNTPPVTPVVNPGTDTPPVDNPPHNPVDDPAQNPIPEAARNFDQWMENLRNETIRQAEGLGLKPAEFAVKAADASKRFSDLAKEGQDYSFPKMAGVIVLQAGQLGGSFNSYAMKVQTAAGIIVGMKRDNAALKSDLESADKSAIAKRVGAGLTSGRSAQAEIVQNAGTADVGTVDTKIAEYLEIVGTFDKQIAGWESRLAFHTKAAAFGNRQVGLISAAAGELKPKSGALGEQSAALLPDFQVTPPDNQKLGDGFKKLTGIAVKVGDATESSAEGNIVDGLVLLRGAKSEAYWDQSKIDDSETAALETAEWAKINPASDKNLKEYPSEVANPDAIADNLKVYSALNKRAVSELPAALAKLESDLAAVKDILDVRKRDFDAFKTTVVSYLHGDNVAPGTNSPLVETPASRLNELKGRADNLPATSSDPRYAAARQQAQASVAAAETALEKVEEAQATLAAARTPAERTAASEALRTAQADFDRKVGAAKGNVDMAQNLNTNPEAVKPGATPDNPHNMGQAQLTQARQYAQILAKCERETGGFTANAQANCSVEYSARVNGLTAEVSVYLSPDEALTQYRSRVGIACDFVRVCRGSAVAEAAGCSGMTSGLSLKRIKK